MKHVSLIFCDETVWKVDSQVGSMCALFSDFWKIRSLSLTQKIINETSSYHKYVCSTAKKK